MEEGKATKQRASMTNATSIRCLEFFSGIGGLHHAFNQSGVGGSVVAAWDVNLNANSVYEKSFGKSPSSTEIQRLSVAEIEKWSADAWLMSPPCQPFTRGGKEMDEEDPRSNGFLHLIDVILPALKSPPKYLFIENVLNFESSRTRARLLDRLRSMAYTVTECLLSPMEFGIPNNRERYYCTARRDADPDAEYDADVLKAAREKSPVVHKSWPFSGLADVPDERKEIGSLRSYLEPEGSEELEEWIVPEKWIMRSKNFRFDIVKPDDRRSATFTKAYGTKHGIFAGSVIQTKQLEISDYDFSDPSTLMSLGLRLFTPLEVARLHAFPLRHDDENEKEEDRSSMVRAIGPPFLDFPEDITAKQKHLLLGNSLNVWVVRTLLRRVLFAS